MDKPRNIILTSVLINLFVSIIIVGAGANYLLEQIKTEAKKAVTDLIETTAANSDQIYESVLDFREACGDHVKLFNMGIPQNVLEDPKAFKAYYEDRKDTLVERVGDLHKTLDSPFFKTFDSSYLEELKAKLAVIQAAMEES